MRWLAAMLVTSIVAFGSGYFLRPKLDSNYIELRYDPHHFGEYFYCRGKGWIIIESYVINHTGE